MVSADEREVLRRYTHGDYVAINADLRGDDAGDPHIWRDINVLQRILGGASLPQDLIVYRGVDRSYADHLHASGINRDDIIQDRAFLSTTADRTVARRFIGFEPDGLLLRIKLPKGSKALDVSPYSSNAEEREVLLLCDTQLRVVGYDEEEDVLDLEALLHV